LARQVKLAAGGGEDEFILFCFNGSWCTCERGWDLENFCRAPVPAHFASLLRVLTSRPYFASLLRVLTHFSPIISRPRSQFGLNVHPHIATVTYLSDKGGPTVVLEHTSGCEVGEDFSGSVDKVFMSYPEAGKHMSFDGRFLHLAPTDLMGRGEKRWVGRGLTRARTRARTQT
jgi:hypothetical protein